MNLLTLSLITFFLKNSDYFNNVHKITNENGSLVEFRTERVRLGLHRSNRDPYR